MCFLGYNAFRIFFKLLFFGHIHTAMFWEWHPHIYAGFTLEEQWTGQKYTWKCMWIEARAHFLKHPQYLILKLGLDKTSCVRAVFIFLSFSFFSQQLIFRRSHGVLAVGYVSKSEKFCEAFVIHFPCVLTSVFMTVECLTWHSSPKHMIRRSARFDNSDSTMKILSRGHPYMLVSTAHSWEYHMFSFHTKSNFLTS